MRYTRRQTIIGGVLLSILAVAGYLFFMHTTRGSSLALYAFAGLRAPLGVKIDCAYSTDARVAEKFQQPLDFSEEAKDSLRGFWYYDYFRECLYERGFDISGRRVPKSSVTDSVYRNPYIGIEFAVPSGAVLNSDNQLDVEFDDRLYVSEISVGATTILVHGYLKDDTRQTLDAMAGLSSSSGSIVHRETVVTPTGIATVQMTHSNGASETIFRAPGDWSVSIFSTEPNSPVTNALPSSLRLMP